MNRKKTSKRKGENQQQTQTTYGVDARIWTPDHITGRRVPSPLHHPALKLYLKDRALSELCL